LILEAKLRDAVDMAKNLCITYSHLWWPPENGPLESAMTSKTFSGGYLFVYSLLNDPDLYNYKVNPQKPCTVRCM
jgi:hypothetical protein